MWIINNSNKVLDNIMDYNENKNTKNVNTYDFSTLYANIPHKDLKDKMKWLIDKAFYNNTKRFIYIAHDKATWYKSKHAKQIDKATLIEYIVHLIDNVYISVNSKVFRQVIGIPMGTDCAPFLANLYLYALEYIFLERMTKEDIHLARKFSNSFRYIDDLLMFNNDTLMTKYKHDIYPKELVLNKENKSSKKSTFLDIEINIQGNMIYTNLYDKRDDFSFNVNNFPIMSSNILFKRTHGIVISQMLRHTL